MSISLALARSKCTRYDRTYHTAVVCPPLHTDKWPSKDEKVTTDIITLRFQL